MSALLETNELTVSYGGLHANSNVNIKAEKGKLTLVYKLTTTPVGIWGNEFSLWYEKENYSLLPKSVYHCHNDFCALDLLF